jgi:hypothetical protein
LSVRHHGFSHSSLCKVTSKQAPRNLLIDTYGIELIHPMREGRSPQHIGRKGLSNHRWIVGGKLLTGCKFQVPQNLRRLINVYAINFMP